MAELSEDDRKLQGEAVEPADYLIDPTKLTGRFRDSLCRLSKTSGQYVLATGVADSLYVGGGQGSGGGHERGKLTACMSLKQRERVRTALSALGVSENQVLFSNKGVRVNIEDPRVGVISN